MRSFHITAAALLLPALMHAGAVNAQDVQYETVTKLDMPGALGTMMRAAAKLGGGSTEDVQKTYVKGRKMRTDSDNSSTIVDLDGKRIISLDHEAKTYTTMTFEQMAAQMQQAAANLRNERANVSTENSQAGQQQADLKFKFSTDAPGEHQKVSGYDAERFFLTMEMEGDYTPEGATEREKGTLVLFTDMWASKDVPIMQAMSAFREASAEEWANTGSAATKAIAMSFANNPNAEMAFEQSAKEAEKIQGMPLRSIVYFVGVAPDQKFDRELALGDKSKSDDKAESKGGGLLGGLARLARQQEAKPTDTDAEQPTQGTILSVTTETRNISTKPVDPGLFEIPAGYAEVTFEDLMSRGRQGQ